MTPLPLFVIDRKTGLPFEEKVWGDSFLSLLYGNTFAAKTFGRFLLHSIFRWPCTSTIIGWYYNSAKSKPFIKQFCDRFSINTTESSLSLHEYKSFADFFTRRLRPECRPFSHNPIECIAPADGRYRFIQNLSADELIPAKGEYLNLESLLGSPKLATLYYGGTAILCRLCPADCHRFIFPCDGITDAPKMIHGPLFSVNPIATTAYPWILWTNRRMVTTIQSPIFKTVSYIEIGATNCGSIIQECVPNSFVKKGQEKGFFQLGGSFIILLFQKDTFTLAPDLHALSDQNKEIYCQYGQTIGCAT